MKFIFAAIIIPLTFLNAQPKSEIIGKEPGKIEFTFFASRKTASWENFRGKVVLLDFWASWCAPCIQAIPHMNELSQKYKNKDVVFISLTYEPRELVEKFLQKYPMKTAVALDNDFQTFRTLNGWAIPNIFMVDKNGKIAGRIHPNKLNENVIDDLLAGEIPDIEQTREDLYEPGGAEEYFRKLNEQQKKKWLGTK